MGTPFGALALSGGQYVTTPHHSRLDFATESFTVNCHFKVSADGHLVNKFDTATTKGWKLEITGGFARFTVNGTAITSGSALTDAAWHDIEAALDRSRDHLLLFIDGVAITPVSMAAASTANSAAFQVGKNPASSATLAGTVSEVRLSAGVRHSAAFTPRKWQFSDDGLTRLLWHFNEGKGTTVFDASAGASDIYDAGARHNGTFGLGGNGTWAYGPIMANPERIVRDALWYALDVDAELTAYGEAAKMKRHRLRKTDESTLRVHTSGLRLPSDMPGISIFTENLGEAPPETVAYHEIDVPILIHGSIHNPDVDDLADFRWLILRAIQEQETTSAGHFLHTRIQNWAIQKGRKRHRPTEAGGMVGEFVQPYIFYVRADIRTAGTP